MHSVCIKHLQHTKCFKEHEIKNASRSFHFTSNPPCAPWSPPSTLHVLFSPHSSAWETSMACSPVWSSDSATRHFKPSTTFYWNQRRPKEAFAQRPQVPSWLTDPLLFPIGHVFLQDSVQLHPLLRGDFRRPQNTPWDFSEFWWGFWLALLLEEKQAKVEKYEA